MDVQSGVEQMPMLRALKWFTETSVKHGTARSFTVEAGDETETSQSSKPGRSFSEIAHCGCRSFVSPRWLEDTGPTLAATPTFQAEGRFPSPSSRCRGKSRMDCRLWFVHDNIIMDCSPVLRISRQADTVTYDTALT